VAAKPTATFDAKWAVALSTPAFLPDWFIGAFSQRLLAERVKVVLRRASPKDGVAPKEADSKVLERGELRIDPELAAAFFASSAVLAASAASRASVSARAGAAATACAFGTNSAGWENSTGAASFGEMITRIPIRVLLNNFSAKS
jgi:hypothetical protein